MVLIACLLHSTGPGIHITHIGASGDLHLPGDLRPRSSASRDRMAWSANRIRSPHRTKTASFDQNRVFGSGLQFNTELDRWRDAGRLREDERHCVALSFTSNGIVARLDGGDAILCNTVVLAAANGMPSGRGAEFFSNPWTTNPPTDPDAPILLLGSGLTMIDRVQRLLDAGHRGRITVVSRYALLPQIEKPGRPLRLSQADIPLGCGLRYALHWLKSVIAEHVGRGGDWRGVIDGIAPFMGLWWRHLPAEGRRAFLRHFHRFWDTHRHRMSPEAARRIEHTRSSGQLRIIRGQIGNFHRAPAYAIAEVTAVFKRKEWRELVPAGQVSDCRGLTSPFHGLTIQDATGGEAFGYGPKLSNITAPRLCILTENGHRSVHEFEGMPDLRDQAEELATEIANACMAD